MENPQHINLTKKLKEVEEIAEWFEKQEEVDLELGLEKVHMAGKLIQDLKARLREIENEFNDIKKNLEMKE